MASSPADGLRLLRLEHAVTRLLAADPGSGVEEALLEAVGSSLEWDHCAVWAPEGDGTLVCGATWAASERPALDAFEALTRDLRLGPGEGLPGRVWQTGRPAWIDDVVRDPNFPRAEAAAEAGLHAAMCFPIAASEGPVAVVEVMTTTSREPDPDLLGTLESLGHQVGRFFEHRVAEAAVRDNEARLRATLDAALDAIITMDHRGRIVGFNPAAERVFGHSAEEANGREMAELLVPPSLRERHRKGLARYLDTGEAKILGRRIEITGLRADGSEFPVELTITKVAVPGPPLFTGHLRDITERKEMIEELRASRARLVAAADEGRRRLERDLHDGAQQRLVSMGLDLQLAREHLADGEIGEGTELLDTVTTELREATAELRELARGLHPAILSRHGLETAVEALAVRAPFEVRLSVEPGTRPAETAEAAAYYVIAESLTNAARYADADMVRVDVSRTDGHLVVTVTDDGGGGASMGGGTGLMGLHDRVTALGGELELHSPVGEGTRLEARLPDASGQD